MITAAFIGPLSGSRCSCLSF